MVACARPVSIPAPAIVLDRPPAATVAVPPATRRDDVVGDPYRWLEDETSAEVRAWATAQDDYARGVLRGLPGRDALAARFRALYEVDAVSTPLLRGRRTFYVRSVAHREKAALYWRADGAESILLDPNQWSADTTVSLGAWSPSWDGRRVAYMVQANAADEATLRVIDVDTGVVSLIDTIPGARYATPDWTPDGLGFYYEWLPTGPAIPADQRPGHVEIRYHALGTDPTTDAVVHQRTDDPTAYLGAWMGPDGRYLFVEVARGWSENDVYVRDLQQRGDFRLLVRGDGARYAVTAVCISATRKPAFCDSIAHPDQPPRRWKRW